MNTEQESTVDLPNWVREALEGGDPTDNLPNKRGQTRKVWTGSYLAQPMEGCVKPFSVRLFNVGFGGLGMISRQPIEAGQRLRISPRYASDESDVVVAVIHCTQTVQGYKIGCRFEPA